MSSCVSCPTRRMSVTRTAVAIERQPDRPRVAQRVVEQPHVESIDRRVHEQMIDVAQLADDAHRSADDGGRVGRELRQEQTHVRIERGVGDRERRRRRPFRVSAIWPATDTDRRGDAASSCTVISSLLTLMPPTTWPMPSSATNTSRSAPFTS